MTDAANLTPGASPVCVCGVPVQEQRHSAEGSSSLRQRGPGMRGSLPAPTHRTEMERRAEGREEEGREGEKERKTKKREMACK